MTILTRYLPPLPKGIAAEWIASRSLTGKLLLDPFGAAPDLAVEAARSGARLIVAANNPIARLLIEVAANPPTPAEARNTLALLSASRIRDERLEPHIRALYATRCPNCQADIHIDALLWEREADFPFARLIQCPHCETSGEYPVTEADKQRAAKFSMGGLHGARALERVAPLNDPDRVHVEEALNVYPPRAVYALLTIINKLDALSLPPKQEKTLAAMLLHAFDRANTLWPHPVVRERPRQLTVPPVYRENNIWLALENIVEAWPASDQPVSLTPWPELPPMEGGICLFDGRIKELAEQLTEIELAGVLMALPRPNQAYWTLSALWAGWLWGYAAVEHFKSVLRRRRYDWGWHTTAIQTAFESLRPFLPEELPCLGLIGESEPGFIAAALIASTSAGFALQGFELNNKERLAKINWYTGQISEQTVETQTTLADIIQNAARGYLLERGEPCSYLQLHTAGFTALAKVNLFPFADSPAECYNQTQQAVQTALDYRHGFLRFGGSEKSLEVGQWWLTEAADASLPMADRVEMTVAGYLIQNPGCTLTEVESVVFREYSGLLTPDKELVIECLESYGEKAEAGWRLRGMDAPPKRRIELASMVDIIIELGEKLGFGIQSPETDSNSCVWLDKRGAPKFAFYISASAVLGKFLIEQNPTPARGLIVIPGGRSNLVMYKLQRDPRLKQNADQNWQFAKFRQIRQLADSSILSADNFEAQLGLDPLTYQETQMRMF